MNNIVKQLINDYDFSQMFSKTCSSSGRGWNLIFPQFVLSLESSVKIMYCINDTGINNYFESVKDEPFSLPLVITIIIIIDIIISFFFKCKITIFNLIFIFLLQK